MSLELTAKPIIDEYQERIKNKANDIFNEYKLLPTLLLIRVGERLEDISYEKVIIKNCEKTNINCKVMVLNLDISQKEINEVIITANKDKMIHGILIFRPLPDHLDQEEIALLIDPKKDVDCMSYSNIEKLFTNRDVTFTPCTAQAAIKLLEYYDIPIKGKDVCVVGTSMVVGKPLSMLFLDRFATVTMCHIYTNNLKEITKKADIIVTAIGKAKFFTKDYFKKDAVVVDIGVSLDNDNKRSGDVDFDNVLGEVKAISPMSNGVGNITTTILLDNVIKSCKNIIH